MPQKKWANYYLISMVNITGDPNRKAGAKGRHKTISSCSDAYKSYYSIPEQNCLTLNVIYLIGVQGGRRFIRANSPKIVGGSLVARDADNPLGNVSLNDKLMIVGHGAERGLEHLNPEKVATALYYAGLRNVGLIAFKSCNLGKGQFLDMLKDQLVDMGVNVGWLIGYRDLAATSTKTNREGQVTSVHENIKNKYGVFDKNILGQKFLRGMGRTKVVQGNATLTRPGIRDYSEYLE